MIVPDFDHVDDWSDEDRAVWDRRAQALIESVGLDGAGLESAPEVATPSQLVERGPRPSGKLLELD